MQLFYEPNFSSSYNYLNPEESNHCVKVLRKKNGDEIRVTNGQGKIFTCTLKVANPKKCELTIITEEDQLKASGYFHLAIAPTKNNDRMEWLVEKCTEIGIDEITFFYAQNSERTKFKIDRSLKKSIAAMKQSLAAFLPIINEPVDFSNLIKECDAEQKFIAHFLPENNDFHKQLIPQRSCLILIGPEGDFSEKEIQIAADQNFNTINLGKSRLRTETAGLVACHTYSLVSR